MFFTLTLSKDIELHPKYFGAEMKKTLQIKLKAEVRRV